MIDENKMWELIDLVICDEVQANEAITSAKLDTRNVYIRYNVITKDHTIRTANSVLITALFLQTISIPTLRLIIKELIQICRSACE